MVYAVRGMLHLDGGALHFIRICSDEAVTSAADNDAVNAALERIVASGPTSKTTDVYNAWTGLLNAVLITVP